MDGTSHYGATQVPVLDLIRPLETTPDMLYP